MRSVLSEEKKLSIAALSQTLPERLTGEANAGAEWKAETIDRWIYRSGLGGYLTDGSRLATMGRSERYESADNIVIDEMSMVDLPHLALLCRALEVHQSGSIKRVILVGDENQLPPIGCGRPFHDIITYIRENAAREQRHLVRLTTNCRQQHDKTVLDAAHLFAGKNRYHTDLYERLLVGGKISSFLTVEYWEDVDNLHKQVAHHIDGHTVTVKPDFTVICGGKTLYWEHLGMLDRADYSWDWKSRRAGYRTKGLENNLVTSDDLGGVRHERLREVIAALIGANPGGDSTSEFSLHHYSL